MPKPEKLDILRQLDLDVSGLHINYRENTDAYRILENYIAQNNIEFLAGSSFGGMLAYYLAGAFQIPALLFNPALHFQNVEPELPSEKPHPQKNLYVVLGAHDQTVNPKQSLQFFKDNKVKAARIVSCHWLAHKIDLQTFREMSAWAVNSLYEKNKLL